MSATFKLHVSFVLDERKESKFDGVEISVCVRSPLMLVEQNALYENHLIK